MADSAFHAMSNDETLEEVFGVGKSEEPFNEADISKIAFGGLEKQLKEIDTSRSLHKPGGGDFYPEGKKYH